MLRQADAKAILEVLITRLADDHKVGQMRMLGHPLQMVAIGDDPLVIDTSAVALFGEGFLELRGDGFRGAARFRKHYLRGAAACDLSRSADRTCNEQADQMRLAPCRNRDGRVQPMHVIRIVCQMHNNGADGFAHSGHFSLPSRRLV